MRGEDDVVAEQVFDPEAGVGLAGEDGGGGLDHGEQRGDRDGEEDEREHGFAGAGAQRERGEEGSVQHEGPGAQRQDDEQKPAAAPSARRL